MISGPITNPRLIALAIQLEAVSESLKHPEADNLDVCAEIVSNAAVELRYMGGQKLAPEQVKRGAFHC